MLLKFFAILSVATPAFEYEDYQNSNEIPPVSTSGPKFGFPFRPPSLINEASTKLTKVYWNTPTFQCDYHKLNFSGLAEKYKIIMNKDDRFHGNAINILYDPGNFPAVLKNGTRTVLRNGGVPQEGNLTDHLIIFEKLVQQLIPDESFSGIGIIDFESWRPVFRQNFGALSEYKVLSFDIEKRRHPIWTNAWLQKEAKKRFEAAAKQFMEETLLVAKLTRPYATWGYYAYPYCFNMSPSNRRGPCPKEAVVENDSLEWLFNLEDNLYPSLYLSNKDSIKDKVKMVEGRIEETKRIVKHLEKHKNIMPYFWYKYHDAKDFLSKEDIFSIFTVLSSYYLDGLVIWGSSNDVNTKGKCIELYHYINEILEIQLKIY
ncbi:unnamed protein product [Acanthoscelides obtectus]|uniref:Hyaluronidase n=2 Tax=Acanthoscelides obtectus TaxID=200917 RepID=A0A9P0M8I6_ACAOB|nr:unnamed protein product [Acanthoscelides obtectus]CAK1649202.1 hypothetical protein AOBTE_LOCUS16095 [Acanthoscelides obtectus]